MLTEILQRLADNDPTLTNINLSFVIDGIDIQNIQTLANLLKTNHFVRTIDIRYFCHNASQLTQAFADALKFNQSLKMLTLYENHIGDQGVQALANALKINQSLTTLELGKNKFGRQSALALADALKINQCLTTLALNENYIDDQDVQALADALKINQCLTTLLLFKNQIGKQGAEALAEALKTNRCVTTLDLCYNNIGDQGVLALANALKINQCLTTLDVRDNNVGVQGWENITLINDYLARNRKKAENLVTAAKTGDVNTVQNILKEGVDLNYPDKENKTALHYAIQTGHIEIAALLLASPQISIKEIPLFRAARLIDNQGNTLLHQAALMAKYNAPLALKLIQSLLSVDTNRYAKNQAGQYPLQLCAAKKENESPELTEIRNLLSSKPAEKLFIDHIINNPHIKPLLDKLSTAFLLMNELEVTLRSDKNRQTYQLPEDLGITLLFDELQEFHTEMEYNDFQCEDKASWNEFLQSCLSNYQTMTTTLFKAQEYVELELKPKKLSETENEMVKLLILHLQQINQAIFIANQESEHSNEFIQNICISSEWVKNYGLLPKKLQSTKKRNRETSEDTETEETGVVNETEIPPGKRLKTDDLSTAELITKAQQLEQYLALLQAEVAKRKQVLADAGVTIESERSNAMSFFPALRK